jgi:hypothetical protein
MSNWQQDLRYAFRQFRKSPGFTILVTLAVAIATGLPLTAIVDLNSATEPRTAYVVQTTDGRCAIAIDSSAAPELADWTEHKLAPVLAVWYPQIVALLPSTGFTAPPAYSIVVRKMDGVAYTSGTNVFVSEKWIQDEMNGEAIGSIVHESVHVVQQYHGYGPSWLVEGIADYVRWFKYEPQSHGADIVWMQTLGPHPGDACSTVVPCIGGRFSPRYDASYRISANFLNWVSVNYDSNVVTELNADLRQGKYTRDFWKRHTNKTVRELGDEWKQQIEVQLHAARTRPTAPELTSAPNALALHPIFLHGDASDAASLRMSRSAVYPF